MGITSFLKQYSQITETTTLPNFCPIIWLLHREHQFFDWMLGSLALLSNLLALTKSGPYQWSRNPQYVRYCYEVPRYWTLGNSTACSHRMSAFMLRFTYDGALSRRPGRRDRLRSGHPRNSATPWERWLAGLPTGKSRINSNENRGQEQGWPKQPKSGLSCQCSGYSCGQCWQLNYLIQRQGYQSAESCFLSLARW